ncbi:MAG TPA: hypothetical protein VFI39_03965 [Gemmatimonadales bacterium]|nr:hypothetical protein [Gemmatimonadales bacterium]
MDSTSALLLPHYRQALAEALASYAHRGCPALRGAPPEQWARIGEAAGWLEPADAIRIRRLAEKVRFYEGRAESAVNSEQ